MTTSVDELREAYAIVRREIHDETARMLLMQLEVRHVLADHEASIVDVLLDRAKRAASRTQVEA